MTWFKVDDGFAFHPKTMQASLPAIALWTIAGSWSARNLTDGFIPRHALTMLARGETYLADELVDCQLWVKPDDGRDGWLFHGWHEFNHSRDQVETKRAEDAQRKADWRRKRAVEREEKRRAEQAELDRREQESQSDSARTDRVTDSGTPRGVTNGVPQGVQGLSQTPVPSRPDPVPDSLRESELSLSLGDSIDQAAAAAATEKEDPRHAKARQSAQDQAWFDEFWKAWPRKVSKADARKAFSKALGKAGPDRAASAERITKAAEAVAVQCRREGKEDRFIPHAATWLNGERYDDPAEPNLRLVAGGESPWGIPQVSMNPWVQDMGRRR